MRCNMPVTAIPLAILENQSLRAGSHGFDPAFQAMSCFAIIEVCVALSSRG